MYQGKGEGCISGVKNERYPWNKEGDMYQWQGGRGAINVSVVRGDKGLFSLLYGIPLLSYPGTSVVHVWRATKTRHWQ